MIKKNDKVKEEEEETIQTWMKISGNETMIVIQTLKGQWVS